MRTRIAVVVTILLSLFINPYAVGAQVKIHPVTPTKNKPYKVMGIGGSSALGWDDAKGEGGYLARAFRTVNTAENTHYTFINESHEAFGPIQYNQARMNTLLKKDKPNMVVISFGMLNDAYKKTPLAQIKKSVYKEIAMSLNHAAAVVIVTPASTFAAYTYNKSQVTRYINAELEVAKSFQNPNVHIIDLMTQEDNYIASHGGNIKKYEADSWHPNEAGHVLAGKLLAQDMESMFF